MTDPRQPARTPEAGNGHRDAQPTQDSSAEGTDTGSHTPSAEPIDLRFLAPPLTPGELGRLGGYRILQILGEGGMGLVFRAEDPHLKRPVAIKVMRPDVAANALAADRFLREARAAAAVKHDHVVTIYQVGQDRGVPFLAMEFLRGEPLDARVHRQGRVPPFDAMKIGYQTALGLAAAHEAGLVHRDIKPANIWLEAPEGRVKILDFGLARPARENVQLTGSGTVVGTPAYMSPEQANGQAIDARSDLFSLGVLLYRVVTGTPPFKGDNILAVLSALASHEPAPPRELVPEIPVVFDELIRRLLAKNPADRPQSAREVAELLAPAVTTVTVVHFVAAPPPPPPPADSAYDSTFAFDRESPTPAAPARREPTPPPPAPTQNRARHRTPWLMVAAALLLAGLAVAIVLPLLPRPVRVNPGQPGTEDSQDHSGSGEKGKQQQDQQPKWPAPGFDRLSPLEQFNEVMARLAMLNPKWSRKGTLYQDENFIRLDGVHLAHLSPLAALPWLDHLEFQTRPVTDRLDGVHDLSGLRGLKLKSLYVHNSRVSDLSPLRGMPLRALGVEDTNVSDLSPLFQGWGLWCPLEHVWVGGTFIHDLGPLKWARLVSVDAGHLQPGNWEGLATQSPQAIRGFTGAVGTPEAIRKLFPRSYRSIEFINDAPARLFWKDATTFVRHKFPPLDANWLDTVRAKPLPERWGDVLTELSQRNPHWRGEHFGTNLQRAEKDGGPELGLYTGDLRDLTPLQALDRLKVLKLNRPQTALGPLITDLEPLRGLKLEHVDSSGHPLIDLAALRDMPLKAIRLDYNPWHAEDLRGHPTLQTINGKPATDVLGGRK